MHSEQSPAIKSIQNKIRFADKIIEYSFVTKAKLKQNSKPDKISV